MYRVLSMMICVAFIVIITSCTVNAYPTEFTIEPSVKAGIVVFRPGTKKTEEQNHSLQITFYPSLESGQGIVKSFSEEPVPVTVTAAIKGSYNYYYYTVFKDGDKGWVKSEISSPPPLTIYTPAISIDYEYVFEKPIGMTLFEMLAKQNKSISGINRKSNLKIVAEIKQKAKHYKGQTDKYWDQITLLNWNGYLNRRIIIETPYSLAMEYAMEQENTLNEPKANIILSKLEEKSLIITHIDYDSLGGHAFPDSSRRHAILNIDNKIVQPNDEYIDNIGYEDVYYFPLYKIPQKGIAKFVVISRDSGQELTSFMFDLRYLR